MPDRFEHIKILGSGAFATVTLARDKQENTDVAVKIVALPSNDAKASARLKREVQILGQLQHPSIVKMIAYDDSTPDNLFVIMEVVAGITVEKVLRMRGALSEPEGASLARQMLDVLAYMHALGIVHRDLKPANIMSTLPLPRKGATLEQCLWKLIDFGLSRMAGALRGRPDKPSRSATRSSRLSRSNLHSPTRTPSRQSRLTLSRSRSLGAAHDGSPPVALSLVPSGADLTPLAPPMAAPRPEELLAPEAERGWTPELAPRTPGLDSATASEREPVLSSDVRPGVLSDEAGGSSRVTPTAVELSATLPPSTRSPAPSVSTKGALPLSRQTTGESASPPPPSERSPSGSFVSLESLRADEQGGVTMQEMSIHGTQGFMAPELSLALRLANGDPQAAANGAPPSVITPEVLRSTSAPPLDMFALGQVMWCALVGIDPNESWVEEWIWARCFTCGLGTRKLRRFCRLSTGARSFIAQLTDPNPQTRITATAALKLGWVQQVTLAIKAS